MYFFFLNNLGDWVTRRKKYFWNQKKITLGQEQMGTIDHKSNASSFYSCEVHG